jgi:hypothetical protein
MLHQCGIFFHGEMLVRILLSFYLPSLPTWHMTRLLFFFFIFIIKQNQIAHISRGKNLATNLNLQCLLTLPLPSLLPFLSLRQPTLLSLCLWQPHTHSISLRVNPCSLSLRTNPRSLFGHSSDLDGSKPSCSPTAPVLSLSLSSHCSRSDVWAFRIFGVWA